MRFYASYVLAATLCVMMLLAAPTVLSQEADQQPPAKPDPAKADAQPRPQNVGGVETKGAGVVSGIVRFKGTEPTPTPIAGLEGNAFCKNCFKDKPVPMKDNIVLGKNGDDVTVQNVLVYVTKGLEGKTFKAPKEHAVLDQIDCIYTPHVVAVMAGQTLDIRNSDATLHNVMAQPQQNKGFNFGMPVKNQVVEKVFAKPELKINTRCFMHPWMSAYIHVLEHPFFAITQADGSFTLKGLPPGEYEITVLHEASLLEATPGKQTVNVGADETKTLDFTYQMRAAN